MAITEKERRQKVSEYNREYYKKKRMKLKKQRYDKYHQDPNYRKKVIKKSRIYYNKYRKSLSPSEGYTVKKYKGTELFTIKYLAEVLQYSEASIRKYESLGVIPKSTHTDRRGWRFYTGDQIELCIKAFGEKRANRWTNEETSKFLHNFWEVEDE